MQLTPRGLVMTAGVMLAGGAAFGVITTLAPLPSVASPSPSMSAAASWSETDLGDQVVTYPTGSPTPGNTSLPSAPAPSTAAPSPDVVTSTATPSARPTPKPSTATPRMSPSPAAVASTPRPAATPPSAPRPTARAVPRASTSPRPFPTATAARRPIVRPTGRAAKAAVPRGQWSAPSLQVGANDVRPPSLTSGASVQVTVACSPSRSCAVSGGDLLIDPSAESVTVTWFAAARAGYRAWSVSRGL